MADKVQNAYSLILYRKSLQTSGLKKVDFPGTQVRQVCPEIWRHNEKAWVTRIKN